MSFSRVHDLSVKRAAARPALISPIITRSNGQRYTPIMFYADPWSGQKSGG